MRDSGHDEAMCTTRVEGLDCVSTVWGLRYVLVCMYVWATYCNVQGMGVWVGREVGSWAACGAWAGHTGKARGRRGAGGPGGGPHAPSPVNRRSHPRGERVGPGLSSKHLRLLLTTPPPLVAGVALLQKQSYPGCLQLR